MGAFFVAQGRKESLTILGETRDIGIDFDEAADFVSGAISGYLEENGMVIYLGGEDGVVVRVDGLQVLDESCPLVLIGRSGVVLVFKGVEGALVGERALEVGERHVLQIVTYLK